MSRNLRALLVAFILVGCAVLLLPRGCREPPAAPAAAVQRDPQRHAPRAQRTERPERNRQPTMSSRTAEHRRQRSKLPPRGSQERPALRSEPLVPGTNPERAAENEQKLLEAEPKTKDSIRGVLQQELPRQLPDTRLSADQYERLADAVMRLRATRRVLDGMEPSNENQEVLVRSHSQVTEIMREINEITGASAADLTAPERPWMQ